MAFQCLCERYLPSVWRYVCSRVDGDEHLTEDIVSETVLALVRTVALSETDPQSEIKNPGGWLRTVAHNKIQDHYRAAARVRHLIDGARHDTPSAGERDDPAKHQETKERRAEIRAVMDGLSDQFRTALEWKYLENLSVREIARRWQTTEKAVESILFRARRDFRSELDRLDKQDKQGNSPAPQPSQNGKPARPGEHKDNASQTDTAM